MSTHQLRAPLLTMLAALAIPLFAADAPREQFAYSMPIDGVSGAAVMRLDLPVEIYRHCTSARLDDLRVLNGAGEVVPFALQRPAHGVHRQTNPVALPLFPLRGDAAAATAALQLRIDGERTVLEVQGVQKGGPAAAVNAYLMNASALEGPVDSLAFSWDDSQADFSLGVSLQVSDDLIDWRMLLPRATLARLRHGGDIFEQRRLTFNATRARYWRVTAVDASMLPAFSAVLATPVAGHVPVQRQQLEVPGARVPGTTGEYHFDLGAQLPVDRIELGLPEINSVARVEFFARRDAAAQWRSVTHASVYRLSTADGELMSAPLSVPAAGQRLWRVVVDQRGGGIGQSLPRLRVGWIADQVVFVTRGAGPFEIVYGNFSAQNAEVALTDLLPGPSAITAALSIPQAHTGEPRLAGGEQRLIAPPPPIPWRTWLLWAALLAGVATLAAVALRLARQMRALS